MASENSKAPAAKEPPQIVTPTGRKISSLRRCAKCARRCKDPEFKTAKNEFTPYCSDCRGRFPSLNQPHCVLVTKVAKSSRRG